VLVVRTDTRPGLLCAIELFRDAALGGYHGVAIKRFGEW
jgi:hypothetical protein